MSLDFTPEPQAELEARLTALLLGELTGAEAASLRQAIEDDPQLAALYQRLQQTVVLVRQVSASSSQPAAAQATPQLKLSEERRQKLLAQFKTVPLPGYTVPPQRPKISLLVQLAAVITVTAVLAGLLLPALSKSKSKAQSFAIVSNLRQLDGAKQQWALENKASQTAEPTFEQIEPYMGRSSVRGLPPSVAAEKYVLGPVGKSPVAVIEGRGAKVVTLDGDESGAQQGQTLAELNTLSAGHDKFLVNRERQLTRTETGKPAAVEFQTGDGKVSVSGAPTGQRLQIFLPPAQPADDAPQAAGAKLEVVGKSINSAVASSSPISTAELPPVRYGLNQLQQPPLATVSGADHSLSDGETLKRTPSSGLETRDYRLTTDTLSRAADGIHDVPPEAKPGIGGGGGGGGRKNDVSHDVEIFGSTLGISNATTLSAYANPSTQWNLGTANDHAPDYRYGGTSVTNAYTFYFDSAQSDFAELKSSVPNVKIEGITTVFGNRKAYLLPETLAYASSNANIQYPQNTIPSATATPEGRVQGTGFADIGGLSNLKLASNAQAESQPATTPPSSDALASTQFRFKKDDVGRLSTPQYVATNGVAAFGDVQADVPPASNVESLHIVGYVNVKTATNFITLSSNPDTDSFFVLADNGTEKNKQAAQAQKELDQLKRESVVKEIDAPLAKTNSLAPEPQPEVLTATNAFSTFSLNVADVSFKLAAASLEKGVMPDAASIRSEEFINAFDYRDPEAGPGVPIAFAWERARYPFAQNRDLLRFSLKTAATGRAPGRPLNLVLLLDNSGSMERADRVQIIHEALRVLAAQLQPQDTLSIVTFARTAKLYVDGISGSQAADAVEKVSGLTPEGGTNLEDAMKLAYETAFRHYYANGVNRVVLLTDGAANLGNVDPAALKAKVEANRKQGVALDCFGIGWEGYNDDLLEVLARNGDGRYGFLNTPEEAATGFAHQLAGALNVAAADVKVQVEFNPARVTVYRQIGYAKLQLTKEQFRDNTVDAAEIGAAEAGNALYVLEVNPNGDGPLGTVRVRYKVPGTQDFHEHEWAVPYTGSANSLEQSSPAMRLTATASAFSEWLANSPYATEVTPDALLHQINGVPEIYGADTRPQKLEWMVRQAKSLQGK